MALLYWTGNPDTEATRRETWHDAGGVDSGCERHDVIADAQGHHDFLERGVSRSFAETVDRAFDLPRAGFDREQGIGRRHPEVIVAVRRQRDVFDPPGHVRPAWQ